MPLRLIALGLALMLGAPATHADSPVGAWTSISCELRPLDQHVTREITIGEDGTWSGAFAFFAGPGCDTPFMTFHATGPWADVGANPAVQGAISANFTISAAEISVHHEGAAGFLNSGPCGAEPWAPGMRQDVTATGCAPIGMGFPVTEHELVLVRDNLLFFGARPNDGSGLSAPETRPTALQIPLIRSR
ncbi:MAG: hypothetical protein AAGG54_08340 [Pseudomonadota bacterium]